MVADEREVFVDGRSAAEDYRVQTQAAVARKTGIDFISPQVFWNWLTDNRPKLKSIMRDAGVPEHALEAEADRHVEFLKTLPANAPFDNPYITAILTLLVRRIEDACALASIPIREGVVVGVAPMLGVDASQLAVMETEASIITVSQDFPIFCSMVSDAVALSIIQKGNRACWQPAAVAERLQNEYEINEYWFRIISAFAQGGIPADRSVPPLSPERQSLSRKLSEAMQIFTIAHEYGHHAFEHGLIDASEMLGKDKIQDEYQADLFARFVGLMEVLNKASNNTYLASGVGAVLMLGALDLVRRACAVLKTGSSLRESSDTHPPLKERIVALGFLDDTLDISFQEHCRGIRADAYELIEAAWVVIAPSMLRLHEAGIRPRSDAKDVGGWLPVAPR